MKIQYVPAVVAIAMVCLSAGASATSPYSSQADAPIKALTAEETNGLLEGQGLGFAKAAELNGYPGPRHVLELAEQLGLSQEQQAATQALFERMRSAARADGAALVEAERGLDTLYASGEATEARVLEHLARIESLRSRLRGIHLNAHLEQAALMTRHQVFLYRKLRGYQGSGHHH